MDYTQNFTASYQLPLNLLPIFAWLNADANYTSNYGWQRGTDLEDGTSLGNNINSNRTLTLNSTWNLEKLYNLSPFLKKANERFNKTARPKAKNQGRTAVNGRNGLPRDGKDGKDDKDGKKGKDGKADDLKNPSDKEKAALPKNKKGFEKEIKLLPDTTIEVNHGKNSKKLIVSAKTADGKSYPIKYKTLDNNKIRITSKVDSATTLKISVLAKEPNDDKAWYKTAQVIARALMMVRNVSISYRDAYSMALPGFKPFVGDFFGQRSDGGILSPGLDFAFGTAGEGFLSKARDNGWLLMSDNVATPASTNSTRDLQLRMTLEPMKNFKIDLNASRKETKARSIQYMYQGSPTTQSGTFDITTISLKTAFESTGNANNGYRSKTFEKFCNSLEQFRQRVEAQYHGAAYPVGTPLAGQTFNAENGTVNKYSADVMVPAFLNAYTSMGGSDLSIFPSLAKMLPNWSIKFSGLGQLPWFRDHFKSVNINHAYKSVFAVGAYSTYSTFMEYMNGLGFTTDATTGNPTPSSMFNVSTVSINESFSPLLGIDVTFQNNLTCKLEYKKTRVLNLSMTSVQINEQSSNDWVLGLGYKINDFKLFGGSNHRKVKSNKKTGGEGEEESSGKSSSRTTTSSKKGSVNHDLNLRLDLSYRMQAAIVRDIASMTSSASSGNKAFKLSFSADYTLSKLLTMSLYYDQQVNTPLLSSSSYPTTTRDFGISMKFSLTR